MIECTLLAPYVKDEKPVSLLIIAKPESGKTSAMRMYRRNKGVCYLTDCTAYGLTRDILPKVISGEIRTLMIADLLTPLSKSTKTRKSFVTFLNNLIEEGVAKITTYVTVWEKEARANVITAVTNEAIRDGRHEWATMGFLSRFVLFSYSYPMSVIYRILDHYSDKGLEEMDIRIKIPKSEVSVELPKEIADRLNPIAMRIGHQMNLYGIRAKINFRCLLKTLALRNNSKVVTDKEFEELLELSDYMNLELKAL